MFFLKLRYRWDSVIPFPILRGVCVKNSPFLYWICDYVMGCCKNSGLRNKDNLNYPVNNHVPLVDSVPWSNCTNLECKIHNEYKSLEVIFISYVSLPNQCTLIILYCTIQFTIKLFRHVSIPHFGIIIRDLDCELHRLQIKNNGTL